MDTVYKDVTALVTLTFRLPPGDGTILSGLFKHLYSCCLFLLGVKITYTKKNKLFSFLSLDFKLDYILSAKTKALTEKVVKMHSTDKVSIKVLF